MKVTVKLDFFVDKIEFKKGMVLTEEQKLVVEPQAKLLISEGCLLIEAEPEVVVEEPKEKKKK